MSGATSNNSTQRPAPLYVCPSGSESITFATHWYRLPNNDNFLVCTKCYEDKVRTTSFATLLRCDYIDFGSGSTATCDFNTPRIDSLLRQGVASNDFQPLWSFCDQRLRLRSCPGTQGVKGGQNVKWFKPANDDIPGFVCCEACYEDVVLATNFGASFVPSPEQQPVDNVWSCDVAVPYLRHIMLGAAQRQDWHGFVQTARHSMSLPECVSAAPVHAYTKRWYNTVRPMPIHRITVCEACYLDRAGWQQNVAHCFAPIAVSPYDVNSRFGCDFRMPALVACADLLLAHNMFEKWHHFASLTMSKQMCSGEGITDGEWYGLPNPHDSSRTVDNFEVCAACHAGWNQSADFGHLFRRLSYPPGTLKVCDFNPSAPRYSEWFEKWNQMYLTRDPTCFTDYVSRLAPLPKCQTTSRLANTNWYGDKDASLLICPSCFEQVVRGTRFASAFPLQNTLLPDGHHCSLYSQRMREKYAEACKTGSLDSLFSFALHREEVFQQAIPQLEGFSADQSQRREILELIGKQRATTTRMTSTGRAFMGGNPIAHNFDGAVLPQTIMYRHQLYRIQNDPHRPMMMQLEAKWKEVE